MNNKMIGALTLPLLCLALTGCDRMPAECEEAWDKMDSLSTKMGLSEEQRQFQKNSLRPESKKCRLKMPNASAASKPRPWALLASRFFWLSRAG